MIDLLICIRCHEHPTLVLDCADSIRWSITDKSQFVFAVDNKPTLSDFLIKIYGEDRVYASSIHYGWGAGLFSLLAKSIEFFESKIQFNHFLSVDYDTLFIRKEADQKILEFVTSDQVGLVGCHDQNNQHWRERFSKEKRQIEKVFGKIPPLYIPGEGIQGGCMLLTRSFIDALKRKGLFFPPFTEMRQHTSIADDHLVTFFCRMCSMEIVDCRSAIVAEWRSTKDPRELGPDIYAFHPTKIKPYNDNSKLDRDVRNHFRKIRGQLLI